MQNSSPVPLLGVNSTHLETSSCQANHHKGQRLPIVLRLLAEGSVVVLVLATARSEAIAVTQIGQLRWGAGIEGMIAALQRTSSTCSTAELVAAPSYDR
jgi:hypothetical protein